MPFRDAVAMSAGYANGRLVGDRHSRQDRPKASGVTRSRQELFGADETLRLLRCSAVAFGDWFSVMPDTLDDFLHSPGGQPLRESAATASRGRDAAVLAAIAEVIGLPIAELLRRREIPLDRPTAIHTADAAPQSVRAITLDAVAESVGLHGLTFRHRQELPLRRLLIEIGDPAADQQGRAGRFIGVVIESQPTGTGLHRTTVRFQTAL